MSMYYPRSHAKIASNATTIRKCVGKFIQICNCFLAKAGKQLVSILYKWKIYKLRNCRKLFTKM